MSYFPIISTHTYVLLDSNPSAFSALLGLAVPWVQAYNTPHMTSLASGDQVKCGKPETRETQGQDENKLYFNIQCAVVILSIGYEGITFVIVSVSLLELLWDACDRT